MIVLDSFGLELVLLIYKDQVFLRKGQVGEEDGVIDISFDGHRRIES